MTEGEKLRENWRARVKEDERVILKLCLKTKFWPKLYKHTKALMNS